ncbi:response regulator transcription factor [Acetobacter sp.]|jgi:FixJ family two-component response regulator|uniref:response regulator transcription factor n=1 Tax=Acetobacter sp. TaxID=440 RepID=UPI0025BF8860|nr:response regulator [Acetobacter sp.]MCH4091980.1 response regulator [Acetobacter sp.]MCI1301100.1 response regulator [Acetobacter sp.]MCI1317293.1 response regulator [Acetobacter sp.]
MTSFLSGLGHVIIVDDDAGIRAALDSLLRAEGFSVRTFADPFEFLASEIPQEPSCLLLDVKLGNVNGLDIQDEVRMRDGCLPVIMMTGHGNMPMAVRGMKAGAIDFLAKPFSDDDLLQAVTDALMFWKNEKESVQLLSIVKNKYSALSVREQEVMILAISGLMNKQIASRLSLSIISVKVHRAHVMKKMGARSFADLVRYGELLDIRDPSVTRYQQG